MVALLVFPIAPGVVAKPLTYVYKLHTYEAASAVLQVTITQEEAQPLPATAGPGAEDAIQQLGLVVKVSVIAAFPSDAMEIGTAGGTGSLLLLPDPAAAQQPAAGRGPAGASRDKAVGGRGGGKSSGNLAGMGPLQVRSSLLDTVHAVTVCHACIVLH